MRRIPRTAIILALTSLRLLAGDLPADSEFTSRYYSSRSLAHGPNNVAFADHITALSYNPAGLGLISSFEVMASYSVIGKETFLLNAASSFPLTANFPINTAVNSFYLKKDRIQSFIPGLGLGWGTDLFQAGFFSAYQAHLSRKDSSYDTFYNRAGLLFSPGPLRVGTILESTSQPSLLARAQTGLRFLRESLNISTGFRVLSEKAPSFVFNGGFSVLPWDFLSLGLNVEDHDVSAGFILESYKIKLAFSTLYNTDTYENSYCLSLNMEK